MSNRAARALTLLAGAALLAGACRENPSATALAAIPRPPLAPLDPVVAGFVEAEWRQAESAFAGSRTEAALAAAAGRLAMIHHGLVLLEPAAPLYALAQRHAPREARWSYLAGRLAATDNRLPDARAELERAIRLAPTDPLARAALADVERRSGNAGAAIAQARAAAALAPSEPAVLYALAEACAAAGEWPEAALSYERLLERQPKASRLRLPLAQVYRRMGRAEQADAVLAARGDGPLEISDPALLEVHQFAAIAEAATRRRAEAEARAAAASKLAQLEREIVERPADSGLLAQLGVALLRFGRAEEAVRELARAVELAPSDLPLRLALISALGLAGRHGEALAESERALAEHPSEAGARLARANALLATGAARAALADYVALLERQPGLDAARVGLAAALWRLDRRVEALSALEEGLAREPGDLALAAAWSRVASCDPARSARWGALAIERAGRVRAATPAPLVREVYAMALAADGRFADAATAQTEALAGLAEDAPAAVRARLERNLARYRRGETCDDPALD